MVAEVTTRRTIHGIRSIRAPRLAANSISDAHVTRFKDFRVISAPDCIRLTELELELEFDNSTVLIKERR